MIVVLVFGWGKITKRIKKAVVVEPQYLLEGLTVDTLTLSAGYYSTGSISFSPAGDSLVVAALDLVTDANYLLLVDILTKDVSIVVSFQHRIEADWFPKGVP
jgi:hypothetical protein